MLMLTLLVNRGRSERRQAHTEAVDINLLKLSVRLRRSLSPAGSWWEKDGRGRQ